MSEEESLDPRAEERVGTVLADKWTLERLLGVGGMGAVYAARHRNGARAAVKLLHPEYARHEEVRERFLREGYAANKVEHRSTVKVLDDDFLREGPDAGSAYLVMEMLEGESLDERAERGPLFDEREVLEVLDTVLDVLVAAHAKGVIHRDLKPENLFLAKDPETGTTRLKVLDFGLAHVAEAARVTGHGLALGTPAFMSPEQASGMPDVDGRADLFSLGATAFYVFSGRTIHEADTVLVQIVKMAREQAPLLKSVMPAASDEFCAIIDRSLRLDRAERYPDAASMRADVRALLERRLGVSGQRTLITSVASVPPPPVRATAPSVNVATREDDPEDRRRFPLGLFSLLAVAALAWMFWPQIRTRAGEIREEATTSAREAARAFADGDGSAAPPLSGAEGPSAALGTDDDAGAALVAQSLAGEGADAGLAESDASADGLVVELAGDGGLDDGGLDDEEEEEEEEEDAADGGAVVPAGPGPVALARPVAKPAKKPSVQKPVTKKGTKKVRKKRVRRR